MPWCQPRFILYEPSEGGLSNAEEYAFPKALTPGLCLFPWAETHAGKVQGHGALVN